MCAFLDYRAVLDAMGQAQSAILNSSGRFSVFTPEGDSDDNLSIDGPRGVFELYLAAERPQDARVISRATVDRRTGEVKVDVLLSKGDT